MKATQMMNRLTSWLASLGLMPSKTVTLEVRGRRSGQMRSVVINWVEQDGQRYFLSPRGEAEWVRNVRAAGGEAVIRRRGRQSVRLEELPVESGRRSSRRTWARTRGRRGSISGWTLRRS